MRLATSSPSRHRDSEKQPGSTGNGPVICRPVHFCAEIRRVWRSKTRQPSATAQRWTRAVKGHKIAGMNKRLFGAANAEVSEIGLGCWQLGGTDWGDLDRSEEDTSELQSRP